MTDDLRAERARLTTEGNQLRAQAQAYYDDDRVEEAFPLWDRVQEINRRFRELLPEVMVARCPHSGESVRWPIDTLGLDSWFWEYESTIRRTPSSRPPTWLAMTGAMRLADPVEHPPFTVVPGPEVPFVVPRILRSPGVQAVIAEVRVGAHTGWTISYFGPEPDNVPLVNLWGTNKYPVYRPGEQSGWASEHPKVSEYDFKLTPWLRSGALLWIAPGDEAATLREGPAGCPFVDLPGRRKIAIVANGKIRHVKSLEGPRPG